MGIASLIIIIANFIFSYKGFTNQLFYEGYLFEVDKILVQKDYKRIITSGFLHVNWMHLIFNMIALYSFGSSLESYLGPLEFLLIYFSGLIGGELLSLYIHRNHGDYTSVGASGAVCAVIFAGIALFPGMYVFFLPGWLFGLVYVLVSIYAIRSKKDNIGHDSHLGGALVGLLVAIILRPSALRENYLSILVIAIPSLVFIYIIIKRPYTLLIDNHFFKSRNDFYSVDHKYNAEKANRQREVDRILDKIHRKGMKSLSKEEKETLRQHSKSIR